MRSLGNKKGEVQCFSSGCFQNYYSKRGDAAEKWYWGVMVGKWVRYVTPKVCGILAMSMNEWG